MNPDNQYTKMQSEYYEAEAKRWTPENRDPVVGTFDAHNQWPDYEILFEEINGMGSVNMKALDFGCGPGRCLVKYSDRFDSIDGVDISAENLEKASVWKSMNGVKNGVLFKSNGVDVSCCPSNHYDVVYSVICLQHIAVHDIRMNIMKDIFRVLKPGGLFTFQMGAGGKTGHEWVEWFENEYDAHGTNGQCDVSITDIVPVRCELHTIGFETVNISEMRETGPGDAHKGWLFFKAWKP
jgi:ubiquinone/menaquinone biosynthesis C-methylase UbiE